MAKASTKKAAAGSGGRSRERISERVAAKLNSTRPVRQRASRQKAIKSVVLNIRVKYELKREATATLAEIGISLPEAIRVFLGRIVSEQAFPFELELPNAETIAALRQSHDFPFP